MNIVLNGYQPGDLDFGLGMQIVIIYRFLFHSGFCFGTAEILLYHNNPQQTK